MRASSDPTPIRTPLSPPDPDPDPLHLTETHTYEAPYQIHALSWTIRPDKPYRLAIASLLEQQTNHIDILQFNPNSNSIQPDPNLSFAHPYPPTKTMFIPDSNSSKPDLLATSSDFLRIWEIQNDAVTLKKCLDGHRKSKFFGPVTSFDWNDMELSRVGTASVDTTCTIWDVELGVVDTQLIAHDKEVYDIAWGDGVGVFASVSGDGSVRLFDLRDKEHSLIIYQNDGPLIKLGWNKGNPVYMAAVVMDSNKVVVLDVRYPSIPLAELGMHRSNVNAVSWGLHSGSHICSGGDDGQALFWNLSMMREVGVEPVLAYVAEAEIEQLQWSSSQPDWLALAFSNKLQLLKFEDC